MNESTNHPKHIILASASPRRQELLRLLLDSFAVQPAGIDESVREGEDPVDYAARMAREKARAMAGSGSPVLGADTAVVLADRVLGKPGDAARARGMLAALSDTTHRVYSAVCLVAPDGTERARMSISRVTFDPIPDSWIDAYVASGEPMDKAGAYAIQGRAGVWIRHLEGSFSGVMGLPLYETGAVLREAGLWA